MQTQAAVVGGILTIVGAIVGAGLTVSLDHSLQREYQRWDFVQGVSQRAQARSVRARNVVTSSESSVFDARWDDYILNGYMVWNEGFYAMKLGMEREFPELIPLFETVHARFLDTHGILVRVRQRQNAGNSRSLSSVEEEAAEALAELESSVEQLIFSLFDAA